GRADAAVLVRHFAGRQPHVAAIPRRVPAIPMTRTRVAILLLCAALAASAAAYLRNPPWIGEITSGLSPWEADDDGVRYRWTSGRSSFFVPSDATGMTLPLKPGPPDEFPSITLEVPMDSQPLST